MSERVLHDNDKRLLHEWVAVGSKSPRSYMGRKHRFVLIQHESGWPVSFVERGGHLKRAAIEPVAEELARLAARVAELEAENAKLREGAFSKTVASEVEEVRRNEVDPLRAENAKLWKCVKAGDNFVHAVVTIESSPGMMSVYTIAEAHHCPYNGANWSGELANYRAARAEVDNG